jgi:phosphoribosyl 1,2-cyclic phosphodiesterase
VTTLFVLGSGSGGNAFAIAAGSEVLLVDAGFSAKEIGRRAARVGLDLSRATGLVLTHEHNDHTAGAARLAAQLDIPIMTAVGTWDRLRRTMPNARFEPLALMGGVLHGGFHIESCAISHDAAEPVALSIRTSTGHRIGVAYDLGRPTTAVRFLLRDSHALVLEANHDEILLRTSAYPPVVQHRIAGSSGHLSNRAAAELLAELVHPGLMAVVLAHLSEHCNRADVALAEVGSVLAAAGCIATLQVAPQNEPLEPILLRTTPSVMTPLSQ